MTNKIMKKIHYKRAFSNLNFDKWRKIAEKFGPNVTRPKRDWPNSFSLNGSTLLFPCFLLSWFPIGWWIILLVLNNQRNQSMFQFGYLSSLWNVHIDSSLLRSIKCYSKFIKLFRRDDMYSTVCREFIHISVGIVGNHRDEVFCLLRTADNLAFSFITSIFPMF